MRRAHARANYFAFLPSAGRATHDSVVRTSVVVAAVGGMRSQPLVDSNPQLFSDPSSTMLATGLKSAMFLLTSETLCTASRFLCYSSKQSS